MSDVRRARLDVVVAMLVLEISALDESLCSLENLTYSVFAADHPRILLGMLREMPDAPAEISPRSEEAETPEESFLAWKHAESVALLRESVLRLGSRALVDADANTASPTELLRSSAVQFRAALGSANASRLKWLASQVAADSKALHREIDQLMVGASG